MNSSMNIELFESSMLVCGSFDEGFVEKNVNMEHIDPIQLLVPLSSESYSSSFDCGSVFSSEDSSVTSDLDSVCFSRSRHSSFDFKESKINFNYIEFPASASYSELLCDMDIEKLLADLPGSKFPQGSAATLIVSEEKQSVSANAACEDTNSNGIVSVEVSLTKISRGGKFGLTNTGIPKNSSASYPTSTELAGLGIFFPKVEYEMKDNSVPVSISFEQPINQLRLIGMFKKTNFKNSISFIENLQPLSFLQKDSRFQRKNYKFDHESKGPIKKPSSRANVCDLRSGLNLSNYSLALTKLVEEQILRLFELVCDFDITKNSWRRDLKADQRSDLLDRLFKYTSIWFPDYDTTTLDFVISRASYARKQVAYKSKKKLNKLKFKNDY